MNYFRRTVGIANVLMLKPILALMLFVSGCGMERSTRFYWPTVAQTFHPKPQTVRLPILDAPPKQRYVVIGEMSFDVRTDEMAELYNILQYNGRRNGADAVILKMTVKGDPDSKDRAVSAKMIVLQ